MAGHTKQSPKKYIKKKGGNLPYHECFINEDWKEKGLATIAISKRMPSGNIILGFYLVDIFCLGLKNTGYKFNMDNVQYQEFLDKLGNSQAMIKCDISEAHNIIYGAIDYAEELGFAPHPDFAISEHILNPDLITDGIDEIDFGKDGKPCFISGPDDNVEKIIAMLERTVGEDNYTFIAGLPFQ